MPKLRERAVEFGLASNHVFREMRLGESLRSCVIDAMVGIGIMKTGLRPTEIGDEESWLHDTGKPFSEPVGLDDWVHDMTALRWDQVRYMGNRYRLPLDFVRESGLFEGDSAEHLSNAYSKLYNETGDPRASSLTQRDSAWSEGEFEQMVELYDVWLPFHNRVVTIPAPMYGTAYREPLRVVEWRGPESGPYQILSLSDVPDNTMPLAPAATIYDLHVMINTLHNKLRRQAERQKENLTYPGGAEDDAERLVDAFDGQSIRVDQPEKMVIQKTGGADQVTLAYTMHLNDQGSRQAGNLDMLAGLGAQSDTLGQDRLIAQSASQRLAEMQSRTMNFAKGVMEQIAWYIWDDPNLSVEVEKPITSRRTRTITFDSSRQEGDWLDYNIDIVPFSMQDLTPSMRAEQMLLIHDRIVMPNAQMMAERGEQFDAAGFAKKIAEYSQVSEMSDFFVGGPVAMGADEQETNAKNKPLETKRTYERINRPGGTRRGAEKALSQTLLGAGVQNAEMDAVSRPKGA